MWREKQKEELKLQENRGGNQISQRISFYLVAEMHLVRGRGENEKNIGAIHLNPTSNPLIRDGGLCNDKGRRTKSGGAI